MTKLLANTLEKKSKKEVIQDFIELHKEKTSLEEQKKELEKEKQELENELKKYKNSNTPSSANKHIKPNNQGTKAKKSTKRGAPTGHKGATFQWPVSDEIIPVTTDRCGLCNNPNIEPTGYVKTKKVICHIKAKTIIKEYRQYEFKCLDCFSLTLAPHKDIPDKGNYDKNIESLVNYYKFRARLPHGLITDVMNHIHDVPMTPPTSLEITRRGSEKLKPHYNELEEQIRESDVVHSDETSHSVMGQNHWVWVFCNSLISLFKFNKERGGDIVERVLGKDFQGCLVSDGWRTYKVYVEKYGIRLQRCWDHLRREVKHECKEKHPDLYKWCCDIYCMTKKGRKYKQKSRRHDIFEKCKAELERLVNCMNARKDLRKLATKIERGGDDWFSCVLYPSLPIDNNEAERSLRPFVIMRKIMGCLRSDIGKKNYEVMMSLISTWQKQGKNIFYELQQSL